MSLRASVDDGYRVTVIPARVGVLVTLLCAAAGCSTSSGVEVMSQQVRDHTDAPVPVVVSVTATATHVQGGASEPASRARALAPTSAQVRRTLARAVEAGSSTTHFNALSSARTFPDGHGRWLTALIAQRWPTGDGRGQVTFVWHDDRLVGTAERVEVLGINRITPAVGGVFVVSYLHYGPHDAYCCPSKPLFDVTYRWNGARLRASKAMPSGVNGWSKVTVPRLRSADEPLLGRRASPIAVSPSRHGRMLGAAPQRSRSIQTCTWMGT